jgi:cell division protein FtsL
MRKTKAQLEAEIKQLKSELNEKDKEIKQLNYRNDNSILVSSDVYDAMSRDGVEVTRLRGEIESLNNRINEQEKTNRDLIKSITDLSGGTVRDLSQAILALTKGNQ